MGHKFQSLLVIKNSVNSKCPFLKKNKSNTKKKKHSQLIWLNQQCNQTLVLTLFTSKAREWTGEMEQRAENMEKRAPSWLGWKASLWLKLEGVSLSLTPLDLDLSPWVTLTPLAPPNQKSSLSVSSLLFTPD